MAKRAIVIGGSIGGLFTAALLRNIGWQVDIYERSAVDLYGRGAGIVTHKELIDALEVCGASTTDLGVQITGRVAYNQSSEIIGTVELPQLVTSWDRLHTVIRALIPDEHYHLDSHFQTYEHLNDGVRAHFSNGRTAEADLLIGADGFRSAVRAQMHPAIQPEYAGYVVWRGVAPEAAVQGELDPSFFSTMGFCLPEKGEVIGYPIAGINNDIRPGHRQYNWVWYQVINQATLDNMLVDETGKAHKISIPPPLIRRALVEKVRRDAEQFLPYPFVRTLREVPQPFFTPIYDLASPSMVEGNVALVGDAAFVARPHVGMGVTKAAADARVLADCLERASANPAKGLSTYNAARVQIGDACYKHARHLGEYLIPKYRNEEDKRLWASMHNIETIMRDTAVADFLG